MTEAQKRAQKKWQMKNKDKQIEYNRKWRESHREQYNKKQREYKEKRKIAELQALFRG